VGCRSRQIDTDRLQSPRELLRQLAQSGFGEIDREHECCRQVAGWVGPPDHVHHFTCVTLVTENLRTYDTRLANTTGGEKRTTERLVGELHIIGGCCRN